jgi:hypothetical protein
MERVAAPPNLDPSIYLPTRDTAGATPESQALRMPGEKKVPPVDDE